MDKEIGDIFLLNDDTIVEKGWIESYMKQYDNFDIIGPIGTLQKFFVPFWAALIKRKVVDKIGLLDERFKAGECDDVDYCVRALEANLTVGQTDIIFPKQPIEHLGTKTFREGSPEFQKERKKNKQRFEDKWKGTK